MSIQITMLTITNLAADVKTDALNVYNIILSLHQDDAGNQTWKVVAMGNRY